jgi:hypothetical protein
LVVGVESAALVMSGWPAGSAAVLLAVSVEEEEDSDWEEVPLLQPARARAAARDAISASERAGNMVVFVLSDFRPRGATRVDEPARA